MSELRNKAATVWDFDLGHRMNGLSNPFPRGITHADVDSETEISGQFFVIEAKRVINGRPEKLSTGQILTNRERVRQGRTVLVVWGDPETLRVDYMQLFSHGEIMPATWRDFHRFESDWAAWAERQWRPPARDSFVPSYMIRSMASTITKSA